MPHRLALVAVLLALPLTAQGIPMSPAGLPLCEDLNGLTDLQEGEIVIQPPGGPFPGNDFEVAVRVVPSRAMMLEGAELLLRATTPVPGWPPLALMRVHDEDPGSGLPGAEVASPAGYVGTDVPLANQMAWTGCVFQQPLAMTAGTVYWISFHHLQPFALFLATQSLTGTEATPFVVGGGSSSPPWSAFPGAERLKVRLRASVCPPPPSATVVGVGQGCPPGSAPRLLTSGLPLVGHSGFGFLVVSSLPNLPAALFWAPAADPVGTALIGTSGCRLHLDLGGALGLLAAGRNPILTGATGLNGVASFAFPIPDDPALVGASAAFQVLVLDPAGSPTATPGLTIALTPAVVATVGS